MKFLIDFLHQTSALLRRSKEFEFETDWYEKDSTLKCVSFTLGQVGFYKAIFLIWHFVTNLCCTTFIHLFILKLMFDLMALFKQKLFQDTFSPPKETTCCQESSWLQSGCIFKKEVGILTPSHPYLALFLCTFPDDRLNIWRLNIWKQWFHSLLCRWN